MDDYEDIELENFLNKTLDLGEIIESVGDMNVTEMYDDAETWELTTTYSQYKGTCHRIRVKDMVRYIFLLACLTL